MECKNNQKSNKLDNPKPKNPLSPRPHFSKSTLSIAKKNLKEFKTQTDEAFLVRADMNRKLSSL